MRGLWHAGAGSVAEARVVTARCIRRARLAATIARRALLVKQTGLSRAVGSAFGFDPIELGMTMASSFRAGRMGMLCTAAAAAATNITSAGTGSVDELYDCIDSFTSSTGDPGPLFALLAPLAMQSIRDSLRSEVGPLQMRADVQAVIAKGAENILGILCFPSTKVVDSTNIYQNAVFAAGALTYGIARPQAPIGGNAIVAEPTDMPLLIEVERKASTDTYAIVANGYDGIVIREAARIRGLLTNDA